MTSYATDPEFATIVPAIRAFLEPHTERIAA